MASSVATEADGRALTELCAEWQKRLRLMDWLVTVRYRRADDMPLANKGGCCSWKITLKAAVVDVLDPVDYPADSHFLQDVEVTVVHELLHLHIAPFVADDDTPEDIAQEQAIECIAQALVKAKRGE